MKNTFIFLVISLMFLYLNLTPIVREVRGMYQYFTNPLAFNVVRFTSSIRDFTGIVLNLKELQEENSLLKEELIEKQKEISEVQNKLNDFESLENEKQLIPDSELVYARVVGLDIVDDEMFISISAGGNKKIENNLTVVYKGHLVGYIDTYTSTSSVVHAISNNYIDVPVEFTSTSTSGIYTCNETCFVEGVLTSEDIQVGDVVATSGKNGFFKPGLVVGEVYRIEEVPESLFKKVYISNTININDLLRVGVMLN